VTATHQATLRPPGLGSGGATCRVAAAAPARVGVGVGTAASEQRRRSGATAEAAREQTTKSGRGTHVLPRATAHGEANKEASDGVGL